jgi:hypothetical protein
LFYQFDFSFQRAQGEQSPDRMRAAGALAFAAGHGLRAAGPAPRVVLLVPPLRAARILGDLASRGIPPRFVCGCDTGAVLESPVRDAAAAAGIPWCRHAEPVSLTL